MTGINHLVLPSVMIALILWMRAENFESDFLKDWPVYVLLPVTFIVLDLAGYWFHRISHRVSFLWRFHQIHHLDEDFDFTTGLRVHTGEELLHQIIQVIIVLSIGISAQCYLIFRTTAFLSAIFHHANIYIPRRIDRVLGLVIMTPSMHVPHHHELIHNTDSNFGFIFPWWDRLFGTFNRSERQPDWRIGLDYARDLRFLGLVVEPFRLKMLKDRSTYCSSSSSASSDI